MATTQIMRRILSLTVAVVVGLGMAGCQDRYAAEQLLWQANRKAAPLQRDIKQAAEADVLAAVEAYRHVVDRCPGMVEAAKAQMSMGGIYYGREQYDLSRQAFSEVSRKYGQFREMAASAQFMVGQSLERQDKWGDAVRAYEEIFLNQPWTMQAMRTRLYVAEAWDRRGDREASAKAYDRALKAYHEAVKAAPTPELASQTYGFIATVHERQQQWDKALETYRTIAEQYPNTSKAPVALFAMGALYKSRLGQMDRAIETFRELTKQYPEHFLTRIVQPELKARDEGGAPQQ